MLTEPKAFLETPSVSGLRPCARIHLERPCATLVWLVGRSTNKTCPPGFGPVQCLKSTTDSKPKGSRLPLGHLRMGEDHQPSEAISPSLNPHYNRPSSHWPCVKSCLVGGSGRYLTRRPGLPQRRGIRYISQQHGVCVLTTSQSRRCGIQPTTTTGPEQPTRLIRLLFIF